MFGLRRQKVTGKWRQLSHGDFIIRTVLSNIISAIKSRRVICAGHVARVRALGNAHEILVGLLSGKGSLGRLRRRCYDGIKMSRKWGGLNSYSISGFIIGNEA
jgi:hypothetical protein